MRISDWSSDVCSSDLLVHVGLPGIEELLADFRRLAAQLADILGAGDLGGLAEATRDAERVELVEQVADRRIRAEAGGSVRFAAFVGDPQVGDRAFLAHYLGCVMYVLLGDPSGVVAGIDLAVDRKTVGE